MPPKILESARLHYGAALTEIRERQARAPADGWLRNIEAWTLLGLGRIDEAWAASRVVTESVRHPYRYDLFDNWCFSAIPRALLLSDREMALPLIREAAAGASTLCPRNPGQRPGRRASRDEAGLSHGAFSRRTRNRRAAR